MTAPTALLLADPNTFVAGVPHERYPWLRANDPVHWEPEIAERRMPDAVKHEGFWALTRYDDVVATSKDPATFSSYEGTCLLEDFPPFGLSMMRQQLIHMDPPAHSQLRRIVSHGFTPRMIGALGDHVRDLARGVVDGMPDSGECDFVPTVAAELPLLVIAEILGVPVSDRHLLFDWSNRMIGADDPEYGKPGDSDMALMELFQYAAVLANEKRANPTDDILSVLTTAEVDGAKLTPAELNMFFFLLVVAGNETTRNLLSGGMLALHENPDQMARPSRTRR